MQDLKRQLEAMVDDKLDQIPGLEEAMETLEDPEVPVKQKAKIVGTLLLPVIQEARQSPQIAMLPMVIAGGITMAKMQFAQLPKGMITAPIDQQLAKVKSPLLEANNDLSKLDIEAKIAKVQQRVKLKMQGVDVPSRKKDAASMLEEEMVEGYMNDCFKDMGVQAYTDFSKAALNVFPQIVSDLFLMPGDFNENAKASYARIGLKGEAKNALPAPKGEGYSMAHLLDASILAEALTDVLVSVDGDKVYQVLAEYMDGLDAQEAVELVNNGLQMLEDICVAAKKTGNIFALENTDAASAFFSGVAKEVRGLEASAIAAGITSDVDLKAAYKDALDASDYGAKAAPIKKTTKPRKARKPAQKL